VAEGLSGELHAEAQAFVERILRDRLHNRGRCREKQV
jgi:hypothetical protein